ncbi:MAG: hypothetical protein CVU71_04900 [Deltaproteobacteria bacterium HGW-Deltaproteobacteria-6]|jgi:hypothetical protein|nr:MAG: hypothetical protein CVU71_04900 [Deltaproteobacteria bacterium HGW-Deltaproteobacteria-6]
MKKHIIFLFCVMASMLMITDSGWAFSCGTGLITLGDSKTKLLFTCGAPTSKESICLERHRETGLCINRGQAWKYNCGDNDFFYSLVFDESGNLIKEETEGRGMGKSDCGGKLSR